MDLGDRLLAERRARLAAERLLELKSRELFAANRKLSEHALALGDQVVMQRKVAENARSAHAELLGETTRVRSDLEKATIAQTLAERRLLDALETIKDGFAIYDADQRLVMANGAYLAPFDGLEEVGPGAYFRDVLRIGMEEGVFDPGTETPAQWVDSMVARWDASPIESRVVRLWNGSYIKLVDRRGADGGVVSLALDITEATRREADLNEARARAEQASRAKSAFLANMSHELRTPMNGVVGMAELICETSLTEEQRLYAETIKSSGEALLLIINDVLDYSKLEAEKLTLHSEPFDLERLIHEIVVMLSVSAEEKGVSLTVDYDLFLPTSLVGDRGRLRQVLTNLIGNAVKFTPAGHVLVRVVGFDSGGGLHRVAVAVEDTGIGIAPEMREHVFGEFNQVEDERNRKFEGTGLGLAISRQLVRLMGGEIWVESTQGEGSCFGFSVNLPRGPAEAEVEPRVPRGLGRALIVDADTLNRSILERQLAALGIEVRTARTPAEAREARGSAGELLIPDAIFADLQMTAEDAAALAGGRSAPVVVLAASPSEAQAALDAGFGQVLTKPVRRADLFGALERMGPAIASLTSSTAIPSPVVARAAAPPPPAPARPARAVRILAAEDNRTNQLVLSKMLKDLAVEVSFAANGREAVEMFAEIRPDIVFMDISMPEMDGKEATRLIRAREASEGSAHTPVVALTAHAMDSDRVEILEAGLDRHLTKPLKKSAILEVLGSYFPEAILSTPHEAATA
jgi:signal transduction histidine kinase/CheY-like chemotaxis protein